MGTENGGGVCGTRLLIDGVAVACQLAGAGEPVVVLHGWGARAAVMQPVVACLGDTLRVYAPDLPGFGASMPPPAAWTVSDYARLVRALMDRLGIESAHIIGHSFGGRIGIVLAAEHAAAVRRLVLVNSAGLRRPGGWAAHVRRAAAQVGQMLLASAAPPSWRGPVREWASERFGSADYRAAGPLRPTFVRVVSEDLRPRLPAVQAPTLLIWGDRDRETPLADGKVMASMIPDSRLVVLQDAGHFSFLDQPTQFCAHIRSFLLQDSSAIAR